MKKRNVKKLTLHRETVQKLAVGGITAMSALGYCGTDNTCYDATCNYSCAAECTHLTCAPNTLYACCAPPTWAPC
jgi:hypothetical protein